MTTHLPYLEASQFRERLEGALARPVAEPTATRLWSHYRDLRRWAQRSALVGSGEAGRIVERHYAEGLLALPLLEGASTIVDIGSGAGFPGWVLAAARPDLDFWLFESRQRKAAFLRAAADRAGLSCRIVGARVSRRQSVRDSLSERGAAGLRFDVVTVRAVRVDGEIWGGLKSALARGARALRWEGPGEIEPWPEATPGRAISLPGRAGAIREWLLSTSNEPEAL